MDSRSRIDPAEAARHREVMGHMCVYHAQWAVSKVLELSDVQAGQNRLLLTKDTVRAGSIPKVFPELEELREDGLNAEIKVTVPVLDAEGRENEVNLRYLNSNKAYRLMGPEWRLFVQANGMCSGDRIHLYTCRRGDGERCLFAFSTKGHGDASACKARKRARQPAADAVRDLYVEDDEDFFPAVNGGRAGGADGKHREEVDCTRAKRDRTSAKNKASHHVPRDDYTPFLSNDDDDGAHAGAGGGGGSQGEYGWCKNEEGREGRVSWHPHPTPDDEREAAKGLLMLKYAIIAQHY